MLALVLAMLFCVAIGAGVVGYVMLEARREGRGEFWTAEGEELIAGARRTGEKVRSRGERIGRTAAERTRTAAERTRGLAARLPDGSGRDARLEQEPGGEDPILRPSDAEVARGASPHDRVEPREPAREVVVDDAGDTGTYRAAS
jgi:hypothetical protein